jgi:hypothetical protein
VRSFFFLVLSFGRQKKVPKKHRPKIQPNGFVSPHALRHMGPKAIRFAHFWVCLCAAKEVTFYLKNSSELSFKDNLRKVQIHLMSGAVAKPKMVRTAAAFRGG